MIISFVDQSIMTDKSSCVAVKDISAGYFDPILFQVQGFWVINMNRLGYWNHVPRPVPNLNPTTSLGPSRNHLAWLAVPFSG
jgi:hypothetical protein